MDQFPGILLSKLTCLIAKFIFRISMVLFFILNFLEQAIYCDSKYFHTGKSNTSKKSVVSSDVQSTTMHTITIKSYIIHSYLNIFLFYCCKKSEML